MDYDDLVDQFIVNDSSDNRNEFKNDDTCEKGDNGVENSYSDPSKANTNELLKIHLRSLIQSRQLARQTVQLKDVKERNSKFMEYFTTLSDGQNAGSGAVGLAGNSEKRNRILKAKLETATTDTTPSTTATDTTTMDTRTETDSNTSNTTSMELIPCRLELDYDGYKLSDVLLLPSNPTPSMAVLDSISSQMCQDYDLPADIFQGAISRCLKDQVEEWHVFQGALEGMKVPFEEIGPVPIRLDIIVGLHRLEDRLELSLDPKEGNTENMKRLVDGMSSPDLRVLKESEYMAFKPLILHNLLEQLMLWRKGIVFGGFHRDVRSNNLKFHDGDVAVLLNDPPSKAAAPSVRRHFADTNSFTPILSVLTVEELDKIEGGRERESRRRRRTTNITGNAGTAGVGVLSGKRSANNHLTSAAAAASSISSQSIVNNLTGTVRSPPRTLPTPTSYRGSLHRIQQNNNGNESDEEQRGGSGQRKRGRKRGYS